MITPDRYFDDLYEYVDLWACGYVKAYTPNSQGEIFLRQKNRFVEAMLDRFEVINKLRKAIGLEEMSAEDCYDYYVNNMPDYDEKRAVIDLYNYDLITKELADKEDAFNKNPNAQAYLLVMGAPDVFIENSDVMQTRLDHINRLLVEGGYNKITPQKTEEILTKLIVQNW